MAPAQTRFGATVNLRSRRFGETEKAGGAKARDP
jgi:hypothetical protein